MNDKLTGTKELALNPGPLTVSGNANVSGNASVGGTLSVTGAAALGSATVTGAARLGSATVTGAATLGSATVTGAATMASANVTGAATLGSATVTGTTELNGTVKIGTAANPGAVLEFGAGASNKESNAGKIGYGAFLPNDSLDIVGVGAPNTQRKIKLWDVVETARMSFGTGLADTKIALYAAGAETNGLGYQLNQFRLHIGSANARFSFLNAPNGTEVMTVKGDGKVGIGTSSPAVPLHVAGSVNLAHNVSSEWINQDGNLSTSADPDLYASTGAHGSRKEARKIGIKADQDIAAAAFLAFSDRRIKEVVGQSDSQEDLRTIQKLHVTEYRYLDKIEQGNSLRKGFIAQEVQAVVPQAVSAARDVIPNIYSKPLAMEFDKDGQTLRVTVNKAHDLKAGDSVRLIVDGTIRDLQVSEARTTTSFVVGPVQESPKQVFVYGKFVDDFLSVDYDRLFTTGIGAIQELARQLEALQKSEARIAELEQKVARIAELEAKAARVDTLEREMAELKKLVAGLAQGQTPGQRNTDRTVAAAAAR